MTQHTLVNLSGRAIPPNAKLAINGEAKLGDYLVIETCDGATGVAAWRTEAEFNLQRASAAPTGPPRAAWMPQLKPKAPYS
ncbi:hypothetical protein [Lacipirellula sp.]|uniref:hypothetical protein n=1 Tax=Lacipirellula sp. TaxID=2691419 RepID=UPI003D127CB5